MTRYKDMIEWSILGVGVFSLFFSVIASATVPAGDNIALLKTLPAKTEGSL